MNIIFISGILEPERSGVGDYTRWLAKACNDMGHTCRLLAIDDPYLKDSSKEELQFGIPTLRLKNTFGSDKQIRTAKKFIQDNRPDWISLQFVPYTFHPKGLVYKLPKQWLRLSCTAKLQIMFHEIWVGCEGKQALFKSKLWRLPQKFFIKRFLNICQPACIHTQAPLYQHQLQNAGYEAKTLSLFSNIEPTTTNANAWLFDLLESQGIDINSGNRDKFWIAGIFGTLHPHWPHQPLFDYLEKAAEDNDKQVIILGVGHMGISAKDWQILAQSTPSRVTCVQTGRLEDSRVAEIFQSLDVGIATSQLSLIPKSCSVISMLENGVPVIVNRLDKSPFGLDHPLLIKMTEDLSMQLPLLKKGHANWRLPYIAKQFIQDLENAA